MSENPLLPHPKLRELHALMLGCRALERQERSRYAARQGLLAGACIHLGEGDLLSTVPNDPIAVRLAPRSKKSGGNGLLLQEPGRTGRLLLCTAAARGMQAAGTDRLVLALAQVGTSEPDWQTAMEWARKAQLPLIFACSDATGGRRSNRGRPSQNIFDFETVSRFTKRAKLPLFPVDGEDVVAVYRVMQECALRARSGDGPAILWAVLTPVGAAVPKLKRSASPLARMETYMAARNISLD